MILFNAKMIRGSREEPLMSEKIESAVGGANRIFVVDDLEGVTFVGKVGLSRYGFNVNAITNLKRVSYSYEMRKYHVAIDTERRVSHNFNPVSDRNGGGSN